jgi:hypothetical protein
MSSSNPVHNVFVLGDYAHISYYKDGYVVLDISDPTSPQLVGQYDTYTGADGGYDGAWGVYPYLPSGNVIVSDMSTGLYICKFTPPVTEAGNDEKVPSEFVLNQNYPNPFNPGTVISWHLSNGGSVSLKIYDVLGNEVATLVDEYKPEGSYKVNFDASNLPSGIYLAKLNEGNSVQTIKMSLVK